MTFASRWPNLRRVNVANLPVSDISYVELLAVIDQSLTTGRLLTISYATPHTFSLLRRHLDFAEQLHAMDLVLADGIGVVLGGRLIGERICCRISIGLIAPLLMPRLAAYGTRVFLFGGSPGIAEQAATRLCSAYPGLNVVGTHHGFLEPGHEQALIDQFNAAEAEVVFIGLGQPLQERWIARHADQLRAPVLFAVGGFLHQSAVRAKYYPDWVTALRVNWAYRLIKEPRRLWRRYLEAFTEFGAAVAWEATVGRWRQHRAPSHQGR
jgi:N-acetylglucosaminyldiphosphoundecaprenol N-acetyl-beta-D-mannosaminyltransferase